MKRLSLFSIFVFIYLSAFGQNTYIGNIILRGQTYFLETAFNYYRLTLNSLPISDSFIVENVEYFEGEIVAISGITKPRYPGAIVDYDLEIETIKKWHLNQDISHFLGEYSLIEICKPLLYEEEFLYEEQRQVVIKAGVESDLLIKNIGISAFSFYKIFILNDSLFIPPQDSEFPVLNNYPETIRGKGVFRNDSLFLYYGSGSGFGLFDCECKGKKIGSTNIESPLESDKNKIYLDAANQVIVIDETLQNESLTVELIDLQGNTIWKKTNVGESVSVAHLPSGIYLCRVLQNGRMIYSDKILKI